MDEKVTHDTQWQLVVDSTCCFETSKALWDAGIRIYNTVSAYVRKGKDKALELNYMFPTLVLNYAYAEQRNDDDWQAYPAPTFDDLLPLLPKMRNIKGADVFVHKNMRYSIYPSVVDDSYYVSYLMNVFYTKNKKPCEAVAEMLLKLS